MLGLASEDVSSFFIWSTVVQKDSRLLRRIGLVNQDVRHTMKRSQVYFRMFYIFYTFAFKLEVILLELIVLDT